MTFLRDLKAFLSSTNTRERRKKYRYKIPDDIPAQLEIDMGFGEKRAFSVCDVNEEAVSVFSKEGSIPDPLILEERHTELIIGDYTFSFTGQLIRYADNFMALRFCKYREDMYLQLLQRFPQFIGASLELREAHAPTTEWLHGINYTDLFISRSEQAEDEIQSLTFVSEDDFYHWHHEFGAKTGSVDRNNFSQGVNFAKRELNPVIHDKGVNHERCHRLVTIVQYANISDVLKNEIIKILQSHQ